MLTRQLSGFNGESFLTRRPLDDGIVTFPWRKDNLEEP
jgi:hypothetical protein